MEQRLNEVTAALTTTQQTLEQSLQEIQRLRAELDTLRTQASSMTANPPVIPATTPQTEGNVSEVGSSGSVISDQIERIQEDQTAMQAEIKLHEQSKIETLSKYPLRISGLILFNAFSNAGIVDNVDLPITAFSRPAGSSHGSLGATGQQTLLSLDVAGPRLWGAKSFAEMSIDFFGGTFFGGTTANSSGYNSSSGLLRLRQSQASLDWKNTTVAAGIANPLISPLSPTSYATVAQPSLYGAGNLWAWTPEARVEQRIPLSNGHSVGLEAGLLDPPATPYTSSVQIESPVEASRRPGYEGRISYRGGDPDNSLKRPLLLGIGAYSSQQVFTSTQVHSWAVTADWQLPIWHWFELRGEFYRGRALGGLGAGGRKDSLTGISLVTGDTKTNGVDAAGGWAQWKVRFSSTLEANAAFGEDDALASNFDYLNLPASTNPFQYYARNSMAMGNFIYRPKTYLIFSPEYRHILSTPNSGPGNVANIFTLSAGYQF